jgi:hypothetical protein
MGNDPYSSLLGMLLVSYDLNHLIPFWNKICYHISILTILSPGNPWCEFCWFVKVVEAPALGKAMVGKFVMTTFAPETLMEGGILAMLGAMVEGLRTESSLLGVVFEMSAAAALPVTLLLVETPAVDLSLSTSVAARSLAMPSSFKVLGTSVATSLPAMCFLGEDLVVLFLTPSFVSTAVAFFFWFLPVLLLSLIATSSKGFILTGVTDVLLAVEEDDDGSGVSRRGQ